MLALAPLLAGSFSAPALANLMPIVALSFTVSVGVVQAAELQRELQFKQLALIELGAAVFGNALASRSRSLASEPSRGHSGPS